MQFNPSKCQVLHITRKVKPLSTKYNLHNVELESASAAKYLGVTIADDLTWSPHIVNTTKKANQILGFLKRNIRVQNKDLKSDAYKSLSGHSWYPLDQRRIDSRLLMMYKVIYDLVAIPAPEYLVRNTRQSRHIHSLAYRQIHTQTITGSHFPPELSSTGTPSLHIYQFIPTLAQFSNAVCQVIHMPP